MLTLVPNHTPRGIRIEDLCKHAFISGVPGSGKTTAVFWILLQLYERGIPLLVIETAKKEYRALKALRTHVQPAARNLATRLEVYTAGVEAVSPLRFAPLWRPSSVNADAHTDSVLRSFKGALPMFEPLPALLGEALELLICKHPVNSTTPTMSDLYMMCRRVLDGKGYSADVKSDMLAAMEVRLGTLTRRTLGAMLRATTCIPDIAHLVTSHCIIEMDDLDVEIKCLLTLFLLSAIHQHIRLPSQGHTAHVKHPRLVIAIEEAHSIVGRIAEAATVENQANPKAYATELICRMLAEFRALGVGLILIDQSPSQVAPQVIKNTGTKLAFRQVARDDREMLADTMLFSNLEYEEIARLLPGEAYLFAEGYHRAHRLRTPNLVTLLDLPRPPTDEALTAWIQGETWYQEATSLRAVDVLLRLQTAMDQYGRQKDDAHRQLRVLCEEVVAIAQNPDHAARRKAARQLVTSIKAVEGPIVAARQAIEDTSLQDVRRIRTFTGPHAARTESLRNTLLHRWDDVIRPQLAILQDFIATKVAQLESVVIQKEA